MHFGRAAFTLLALPVLVLAQKVIEVNVGDNGLFFNPPMVNASVGDIVTFHFIGRNHSVTQSSQEDPCTPVEGGFNSGLLGVGSDTTPLPPGVWNLTISDTQPIWYFCEAVKPTQHCTSGMVGAINPPSAESFLAFQSSAKATTMTTTPADSVLLTGIGASATAPPTTTATALTTGRTDGGSSSGTSTGPSPSSTSSSNAAAPNFINGLLFAGAGVAGALLVQAVFGSNF